MAYPGREGRYQLARHERDRTPRWGAQRGASEFRMEGGRGRCKPLPGQTTFYLVAVVGGTGGLLCGEGALFVEKTGHVSAFVFVE